MSKRKLSYLQGTDAARYQQPAEDARLVDAAEWTPAASGLLVRSGIVPGPSSPGTVSATSGGVTISPGTAVVQGTTTNVQGAYRCAWDAPEFRAAPAASASTYRKFLVVCRVYDQLNGAAVDDWDLEVVLGAGAPTLNSAVQPAQPGSPGGPASSLLMATGSVDPAGVVTVTPTPAWTVARGGSQPITANDTSPGAYLGQLHDHPVYGVRRWDGDSWEWVGGGSIPATRLALTASFNNWVDMGLGNFDRLTSRRIGSLVHVTGLLGTTTTVSGTVGVLPAGSLPVGSRPPSTALRTVNVGGYVVNRLDMQPDGSATLFTSQSWGPNTFVAVDVAFGTDAV